jgi:hypothetical protein
MAWLLGNISLGNIKCPLSTKGDNGQRQAILRKDKYFGMVFVIFVENTVFR